MVEAWRWLIGQERSPGWVANGSWHLEFQSVPHGAWAVAAISLALAGAAGVWYLYKLEGRAIGLLARFILATLRCMAIACALLMLLEVVLVITEHESIPSRLLVLIDNSESMGLSDPYTDEIQAESTAAVLDVKDSDGRPDTTALRKHNRLELATRAIGPLLKDLADGRELSIYTFSHQLEPLPAASALATLRPVGVDTAIGDALKNALAAHRGQPLAGVLLVSDGQSNAGEDARKAAQDAGKAGTPIHALAIGTEQGPSNARLIEIETSPIVFVGDPTEVSVLVESRGLAGRTGVVTLEQRTGAGDWKTAGDQEIIFGDDTIVRRAAFRVTPESVGQMDFRGSVSEVGPELSESDNTATASIKVVRQQIRVLLIAGSPSDEVQFLRNTLLREKGIEFASWLQSAGPEYEHPGHRPIRRLPASAQELEQYDVLILFDPDMRALSSAWPEMLTKFVGDAGGGLIYVAGELFTPQLFSAGVESAGAIDDSWIGMLPVLVEPGLYKTEVDVRLSARESWVLELTPEGLNDSIFRFDPDANRNHEVLSSLPGMYWHFPVTRAKQGAIVLARHGDPRMRNQFGRHVLMATQLYGPGRTVFIGFDSTYRWRYLREEYFDGFWARLIDRVGRNKVLGGRYPFTLATDKSLYRLGDRVLLRAQLINSAQNPISNVELRGEIERSGQQPVPIELEPLPDRPELLEASFTPDEAGSYLLRLIPTIGGAESDPSVRPATLSFRVEAPHQEIDRPVLDRVLLEDVARASGGTVFPLTEYRRIPAAFKVKEVDRVLEYRKELWDAPLLFGGLVLLLTLEWVLRKRARMA